MVMNVPPDEIPYFRLGFIFMFLICLIGFVLSIGYLVWELMRLVLRKDVIESDIKDSNDIKIIPEGKSMKKRSVLVIDTPETCEECVLNKDNNLCYVTGSLYTDTKDFDCTQGRLKDCPLKYLPERRSCNVYTWNEHHHAFDQGVNYTIDKITGETYIPDTREGKS